MPGLARALSKLGYCSRTQAAALIRTGQVTLNGRPCRDPERPVQLDRDTIAVSGAPVNTAPRIYLMLNKPRGLVTTTSDEQGRPTVFDCLARSAPSVASEAAKDGPASPLSSILNPLSSPLPALSPVGRLDKASEGLLLFTNDTAWAHHLTDPATHLDKTYHVQVATLIDAPLLTRLRQGSGTGADRLTAKKITVLRQGGKNTWLEIILDEGKNRHIRRLLEAFEIETLRLVRVAIGSLKLGDLPKGHWRELTKQEISSLSPQG